MTLSNLNKRVFTSIVLLIVFYLIFKYNFFLIYSILIIGTLAVLEFLNLTNKIIKKNLLFI